MKKILQYFYRNPYFVIIITTCITLFFIFMITKIEIDPSTENLVPNDNRVRMLLEKYGIENSEMGYFLVGAEAKQEFTVHNLNLLKEAYDQIANLPGISSGVTPFNALNFSKKGTRLIVSPMSKNSSAPQNVDELQSFLSAIFNNPLYTGSLISKDGKIFCAIFPSKLLTNDTKSFMDAYYKILEPLEEYFTFYTTGDMPISNQSTYYLSRDSVKLFSLALIFMLFAFYFGFGFKSRRAVFLPSSVVIIGTLWTLGFMGLMGYKLTIFSITIPPLVLSIGSSYAIHILNQFYRDCIPESKEMTWIVDSGLKINKTITLAGTTTIIGFLSLLVTSLPQSKEFGIATSFGIFSCMLLSIIYLPAVFSIMTPPQATQRKLLIRGPFTKTMGYIGNWVFKAKSWIFLMFISLIICFFFAYPRIPTQSDYLSYFPEDDKVLLDTITLIDRVGGFQYLHLTLTAPENETNYFLQPEILKIVSNFEEEVLELSHVSSVSSVPFFIRNLNAIMNGNTTIPESPGLILLFSRYLELLIRSERDNNDLRQLANEDFSQITLSFRIFNSNNNRIIAETELKNLLNDIQNSINTYLDSNIVAEMWSSDLRYVYLSETLTRDQQYATILSIILVFFVSWISFKNIGYALATLIPLMSGIMLNFIFMTIFNIPLDMITLLVTSIAIGVGIDDAIHYTIHFREEINSGRNIKDSIIRTHKFAGRPIMHTTVAIVGGLIFLTLSSFKGIAYFGLLISLTLTFAMLSTLVLLPAILAIFVKQKKY